jgi:hypothetical protein
MVKITGKPTIFDIDFLGAKGSLARNNGYEPTRSDWNTCIDWRFQKQADRKVG